MGSQTLVEVEEDDFLATLYEQCYDESEITPDRTRKPRSQTKEEKREQFRVFNREKRRQRRINQRKKKSEAYHAHLASLPTEEERQAFIEAARRKRYLEKNEEDAYLRAAKESGKPRIVFNCSFAGIMEDKEITSLAKQIALVYADVRIERVPCCLHVTSATADNPLWDRIDKLGMQKHHINYHAEPYWDVFPHDNIIALSPDAEEDLETVDEDTIYVIGGLVDRTICRGQTAGQARTAGIQMRRLPFKKYLPNSRMCPVLNINTVALLLMDMLRHGDWAKAFGDRIPLRKANDCGRKGRRDRERQEKFRQMREKNAVDAHSDQSDSDESVSSQESEQ